MERNNRREIAMRWWKALPFDSSNTTISKRHYFDKYKSKFFTPARNYTELTGREIKIIWEMETINVHN